MKAKAISGKSWIFFFGFLLVLLPSCMEELDTEKMSGQASFNQMLYVPLVLGSLTISDFFTENDTRLIRNLDTITFDFGEDSLFNFDLSDDLNLENTEVDDYIEYVNFFYTIKSEFPVTLNPSIILYDTVSGETLDTIFFTENRNEPFVPAAPVDANGVTIPSQVEEVTGAIRLDESVIYNFFNVANKISIVGSFSPYQMNNTFFLSQYKFDFKFILETQIRYPINLN